MLREFDRTGDLRRIMHRLVAAFATAKRSMALTQQIGRKVKRLTKADFQLWAGAPATPQESSPMCLSNRSQSSCSPPSEIAMEECALGASLCHS
jgi:hypothetical protein